MTASAPLPAPDGRAPQPDAGARALRFLAWGHYLLALLLAVGALAFLYFPQVSRYLLRLTPGWNEAEDLLEPEQVQMLAHFVSFSLIAVVWVHAALTAWVAHCIATARQREFCIIFALLNATIPPLGTVLAVVTVVILRRPEVKAHFGRQTAAAPPRLGA